MFRSSVRTAVAATSVGGTVATGSPIVGATVTLNNQTGLSVTLAGSQYAMSVTWSSLVNGQNLAYPVTSVQIQTSGLTAAGSLDVDGISVGEPNNTTFGQYQTTVSAGINSLGVQTCTNCQFAPLQAGNSRLVQLSGQQNWISYFDITKYND